MLTRAPELLRNAGLDAAAVGSFVASDPPRRAPGDVLGSEEAQAAGERSRLIAMASCVRVRTSRRRIDAVRWLLTVARLRNSRRAISSLKKAYRSTAPHQPADQVPPPNRPPR